MNPSWPGQCDCETEAALVAMVSYDVLGPSFASIISRARHSRGQQGRPTYCGRDKTDRRDPKGKWNMLRPSRRPACRVGTVQPGIVKAS
ncbi:unnamed protein product [Protopolystoma xenopodis]|uniref:Uncharacterized protein n=1 Tax=Protopolystoma xenopodis TaxID=117903 RepID=A0A448WKY3_9PLAT|nr:unnamed protein product [Protopolystoma xenopodis]